MSYSSHLLAFNKNTALHQELEHAFIRLKSSWEAWFLEYRVNYHQMQLFLNANSTSHLQVVALKVLREENNSDASTGKIFLKCIKIWIIFRNPSTNIQENIISIWWYIIGSYKAGCRAGIRSTEVDMWGPWSTWNVWRGSVRRCS